MKQKRKLQRDFSYGGYAKYADGRKMPAFVQVIGGKIRHVSIAQKDGQTEYLHSECRQYDFSKKRDISRLKRAGVVGFEYEMPAETSLHYEEVSR
ncbi:hypothetical protein F4Z98_05935 [Candidatus Poribacteria bacterium]|nr:hypothetical protein [Candidatus Poribacteria bacterium]MYB01781.1 hypothetical protein [Candidatus Poribacteria bacterium]